MADQMEVKNKKTSTAPRGPIPGAARLLRVLRESGPRIRPVCVGLVGSERAFDRVLESLKRRRLVRVVGRRRSWRLAARA